MINFWNNFSIVVNGIQQYTFGLRRLRLLSAFLSLINLHNSLNQLTKRKFKWISNRIKHLMDNHFYLLQIQAKVSEYLYDKIYIASKRTNAIDQQRSKQRLKIFRSLSPITQTSISKGPYWFEIIFRL